MNLPNLPKKNNKREADFGLKFRKWIEANPPAIQCGFEHKDTNGKNYLPFSAVTDDQIAIGLQAKTKGVLIRVQAGTVGAPDYVWLRAYCLVINYPQGFEIIDIESFVREKKISKSKSLQYARAKEISIISVINKK